MLIARRLALDGVSETSSSACDTDVSGGDVSSSGGDFDCEVDAVMAEVERDTEKQAKIERLEKALRTLKAENPASSQGATLATVPPTFAPAPTWTALVAAAAAEEKPKKLKRGQGQSVKYAARPVSAYVRARTVFAGLYLLVCTVTLVARRECHVLTLTVHIV